MELGEASAWTGKVVDRYRIGSLLGRGGMGEVYSAVQEGLNRPVAVKVISEEALEKKSAQKRFEREIMACAGLPPHPNIVQVFDAGIHEGRSYYVMEQLTGRSLAEVVEDGTTLSEDELYRVLEDLANALSHLHEHGVLHRDIKPANVMITDEGPVKLMDFGLAWMKDLTRLTKTGKAIGTPAYMSPEMLRGHGLCEASDLFQLGAVVYELASGRPLARGQSLEALIQSLLAGETVPPCRLNPDVGQGLSDIVVRCVERDVARRYAKASEVLADLAEAREARKMERLVAASPPAPSPDPPARGLHRSGRAAPVRSFPPSRSDGSSPSLGGGGGDGADELLRRLRGVPFVLWGAAALVLLGLVFSAFRLVGTRGGGSVSVPIREFVLLPGIEGVRLRWATDEAMESVVGVRREGRTVERVVRGEGGKARRHDLLVRNLEAGRTYAFNVILADGSRSLTRRLSLPSSLQVEGPSAEADGRQLFRFNMPLRAAVEYRCGNRVLAEPLEEEWDEELRFLPRRLDPLETIRDLRLTLHTVDGEVLRRGPYEIPSLPLRLGQLLDEERIGKLREGLWDVAAGADPWKALRDEMARSGAGPLLDRFQGLAASYFSRETVPLDERLITARRLQVLQLVDAVAVSQRRAMPFGVEKLLRPLVHVEATSEDPGTWDLVLEAHRDLHVPFGLSAAETDRLKYGTRLAYPEVERFLDETRFSPRFDGEATSRAREVVVTVRIARAFANLCLEVDLNGRLRALVHRVDSAEDPLSPTGMYARVQGWMDQKYQSPSTNHRIVFHGGALRREGNELRLRFLRLGGPVPAFPSLRSVAVRLR